MSEPVGPAAQEAARLLAAVQDWAHDRVTDEHLATGAPECLSCPLCQAVTAMRSVRPGTLEHLRGAAGSLLAAVRGVVGPPPPPPPPPYPRPGVQHIDVREG